MNDIKIGLFGKAAECLAFSSSPEEGICFDFGEGISGYLSVGGITKRVENGGCVFDTRALPDGEYEAALILGSAVIKLPKFKKTAKKIRLTDLTEEYIRGISVRERRLAETVERLEGRVSELEEKISSAGILKFR